MGMSKYSYVEFSGAIQQRTSTHIKKPNELVNGENIDFWSRLGSMVRRAGSQSTTVNLPKLPTSTPTLSAFIARYPGQNEIWASSNSTTQSILRRFNGTTWDVLKNDLPLDAELNFINDVDEVWVGSYDLATDTIGESVTIDAAHNVSPTRHLKYGPDARFFMEFNGAVYAANVLVDGTRYRDRVYKSSGPTGVISFIRQPVILSQTIATPTVLTAPVDIDSVRYLKPGMDIDIYKAGTNTRIYQLQIAAVDKSLDTITINPESVTFPDTAVNTGTDIITVPSNTWMETGMSTTLWSTTPPGGTVSGTIYYVIRLSATTIKLAASYASAMAGTAIDLTSAGTGTHRLTQALVLQNRDEIWGRDRKGKLTRYWNTDYRNPENADWFKLPATLDASNDITAIGKLTGRMFMFTENSMIAFDGANRVLLRNDVGCISMKTICYYDSFMAWMDNKGQIWYRNEEAGEMDILSIPIEKTLKQFTNDELRSATAVCVGPVMKIYIGRKDGRSLRAIYHFQANQWSLHWHDSVFSAQLEYKYSGTIKPHWFDETGQMWVDEVGTDDNGQIIPFVAEVGDDTFGQDEEKSYKGAKIYSEAAAGTKIFVSVDRREPIEVGELSKGTQAILFKARNKADLQGTSIDLMLKNSSSGEAPAIDKAVIYYQKEEDTLRET